MSYIIRFKEHHRNNIVTCCYFRVTTPRVLQRYINQEELVSGYFSKVFSKMNTSDLKKVNKLKMND